MTMEFKPSYQLSPPVYRNYNKEESLVTLNQSKMVCNRLFLAF